MRRLHYLGGCLLYLAASISAYGQFDSSKELNVHIDSQGIIYVLSDDTGERLDENTSRERVEMLLVEEPGRLVIIQADPEAPTEALVHMFDWLYEIGAGSIAIAMGSAP